MSVHRYRVFSFCNDAFRFYRVTFKWNKVRPQQKMLDTFFVLSKIHCTQTTPTGYIEIVVSTG